MIKQSPLKGNEAEMSGSFPEESTSGERIRPESMDEALNLEFEANRKLYWGNLSEAAELMYRAAELHDIPLASAQCFFKAGELFLKVGKQRKAIASFIKSYKQYRGLSDLLALNALKKASEMVEKSQQKVKLLELILRKMMRMRLFHNAIDVGYELSQLTSGNRKRRYLRKTIWLLSRELRNDLSTSYRVFLFRRLLKVLKEHRPISWERFHLRYKSFMRRLLSRAKKLIKEYTSKFFNPLLRVDTRVVQEDVWENISAMLDEREKVLAALIPIGASGEFHLIMELLEELVKVYPAFPLDLYRGTYTYIPQEERVKLLRLSEAVLMRELLNLAKEIRDPQKINLLEFYQATLMERLGDLWREHDLVRARELYKVSAKVYRNRGDFYSQGRVLSKLGDLLQTSNRNLALLYYLKAREIFSSLGYHIEEREVKRKIYKLLKAMGYIRKG